MCDLPDKAGSAQNVEICDYQWQFCDRSAAEFGRQRILLLSRDRMSKEAGKMDTKIPETQAEKSVNSLLQLCMKAGKLICGIDASLRMVSKNKIYMLIYSEDLGSSARHKVLMRCEEKGIPVHCFSTKQRLGELFNRRETGILAVSDRNFAKGLEKKLTEKFENETNWEV
jgi:ribosomal protein L7Ae-like RNA K-turn-binding protein